MQFPINNTPRWLVAFLDLCISIISLGFAYLMRFDLRADEELIRTEWEILSKSIFIYFTIKIVIYLLFKIHKRVVRHASMLDIRILFLSNFLSSVLFAIAGYIRYSFIDGYFLFPTTVLILEFMFSFIFMVAMRFMVKLIYLESIK